MLTDLLYRRVWCKRFSGLVKMAYEKSDYFHDQSYSWFEENVFFLSNGRESEIDFDEQFYLNNSPDVKDAVRNKLYPCGYIHFCIIGHTEPRLWSTLEVYKYIPDGPLVGSGIIQPRNAFPLPRYSPDLSHLPVAVDKILVILIPYLTDELFFAGYSGFINDISKIFHLFDSIKVFVTNDGYNASLLDRFSDRIEVKHLSRVSELEYKPALIYAFDTETFFQAKDIFNSLDNTVYYCQDYEAGFYPYGSFYARAQSVFFLSKNIVFSTNILKKSIISRNVMNEKLHSYITSPSIEPFSVDSKKTKKIFFYFRPESFNSRNMPELIMRTVQDFCFKYTDYQIYLVGSVGTAFSIKINGVSVMVLNKLSKSDYIKLISSCDLVVALIYSDHPGVIAFQSAASGIPTITNTFFIRDETFLCSVSKNIIAFDPVTDCLLDKIELGLSMSKGSPDFSFEKYSGLNAGSFVDFNDEILTRG